MNEIIEDLKDIISEMKNERKGTNILRLTDDEFDDLGICAIYDCDNCPLKTIQKKLRRKNKRISTVTNGLMPFVRTKPDLPKVKQPKEK